MRIVYIVYPSDAIVFFEETMFYRQPQWMVSPRGEDVSPLLQSFPIVSALQVGIDMIRRGGSARTRSRIRGGGLHRGMDGGHCAPELDRRGCRQARYRAGDRSGQAQGILVTQRCHPSALPCHERTSRAG